MYHQPSFMPNRAQMLQILQARIAPLNAEESILTQNACHRVLAKDAVALQNLPNTQSAACDGIGVRFNDFANGMPDVSAWKQGQDYDFCNTGCEVRRPFDTVLPIEAVSFDRSGRISLQVCPESPAWRVHPIGAQIRLGETLLFKNEIVTPEAIGLLLSGGVREVSVYKRPRVTFIPTGDELVGAEVFPAPPGKNVESNSAMLSAFITSWGGEAGVLPIAADDPAVLKAALRSALAVSDMLLICAGSSKGTHDFTIDVLSELGEMVVQELGHGPGKHCALFMLDGKPVMGLPGPPGGAALAAELYVQPLMRLLLHQPLPKAQTVQVELTRPLRGMQLDFVARLRVFYRGGKAYAEPVTSMKQTRAAAYHAANARFYLSRDAHYEAGQSILAELTQPAETIIEEEEHARKPIIGKIRTAGTGKTRHKA